MYYPKNQIETNLYSNGKLLVKSTSLPYTGFYFSTYDGKHFSGAEPNDGDNIALITKNPRLPGTNEETDSSSNLFTPDLRFQRGQNLGYSNITNKNPNDIPYYPVFKYPTPTPTEIADGEFRRYIVKKANENIYYEVSERNFNGSITSPLYFPLLLPWIIKGDRETVQTQNIKQVVLIERNLKIRGLSVYLKYDFLKFYQGGVNLPNDFHIMPDGSIMEGKTHEEYLKTLSPIVNTQTSASISSTPFNNVNRGGY